MISNHFRILQLILFLFFVQNINSSNINKDSIVNKKSSNPKNIVLLNNVAPVLEATGNQLYCPGTSMPIVTEFSITDPDDTGIDAIYIQISSGYVYGQDLLKLAGNHPNLFSSWNITTGKLTITGISGQPTYVELVAAVKDVVYSNNNANPSGVRNFSISVGQANYLPSNQHYYQYVPNIGVTWNTAKTLAQASTYYGLQGYLATITSADEAQLAGEQAAGAGWIGGSDEQTEGVWRWMTGPETGTIFWNGGVNGSTPNFAFWNNGEPNQTGDEDYAHVTAPGVGIPGSWNDLSNTGSANGDYQPKGYIVEYGGTPGDPILQISASTTISIPQMNPTATVGNCGSGSFTLNANATNGIVKWYANETGGTPLATGNTFTTPILTTSTTYYLDAYETSCTTGIRTPFVVNINNIPVLSANNAAPICANNTATISVSTTVGEVYWYDQPTGGNSTGIGLSFTTPELSQTTTYYAEGNNKGCTTLNRTAITVIVNQPPLVSDEQIAICEGSSTQLNAGIDNVTYLWSTGETSKNITISSAGIYTLTVTSLPPENCSSIKTYTVIENTIPVIDNVIIKGATVTIVTSGIGDYEYSIDNFKFQDSNVFEINAGGQYTAYVNDKNGCGADSQTFDVLSFPKFFTPNNDGINDYWTVEGMQFYPGSKVTIFDKFGKLIIELQGTQTWNGVFNGKNLPSTDYWFVFKLDNDQPETRGHFTLKR